MRSRRRRRCADVARGRRIERTVRAEEERSTSIFRTNWPPPDLTTFGKTRWMIGSAAVSALSVVGLNLTPSVEVSHQRPKPVAEPVFFEPKSYMVQTGCGVFPSGSARNSAPSTIAWAATVPPCPQMKFTEPRRYTRFFSD